MHMLMKTFAIGVLAVAGAAGQAAAQTAVEPPPAATVAPGQVPGQIIVSPPAGTTGSGSGIDQFGDSQRPALMPPARPSGVPAENLGARGGNVPSAVPNPGPKGNIGSN